MKLKVLAQKLKVEFFNDQQQSFILDEIDILNRETMMPFRIMYLLHLAEFETEISVPLMKECHQHYSWLASCRIKRDGRGRVSFLLTKGECAVTYPVDILELVKLFKLDEEYQEPAEIAETSMGGIFMREVGLFDEELVTDKRGFVFITRDNRIEEFYHISDPYTIHVREKNVRVFDAKLALLPLMVRGVFDLNGGEE